MSPFIISAILLGFLTFNAGASESVVLIGAADVHAKCPNDGPAVATANLIQDKLKEAREHNHPAFAILLGDTSDAAANDGECFKQVWGSSIPR